MISDKYNNDGSLSPPGSPAPVHGSGQGPVNDSANESKAENQLNFDTDHLLVNLSGRTISSAFIVASSQAVQFLLTFASTMVLARLLSPHDFGLVAMVFTIMSFLRVFKEAGLSTATIQREGITHAQVSNLFWINVGVSGVVSLLMAAAAPLIAWFYREPRLLGPTLVLSGTFVLAGSVVQHQALLNRQMRFKALALIQIIPTLVGILAGVGLAWFGWGVWSLVALNLTTSIVTCVMTLVASPWRPQFFKRRSGTLPLLHFGANMTFGAFCYSIARGMDGLLIGRFYGAYSVGLYSRAAAMLSRPLEQFFYPMEVVLIPVFSRLQNQPKRYRSTYLQIYESIALFSMLFTGTLFALAHPITLVLLGPKWEKASVIFAAFTFAALQYPVTTATTWLLPTQGRSRDSMIVSITVSLIAVAAFIVGLPYGPVGVAFSYSISSIVLQMPMVYWLVGRGGPVNTADLWFGFLKYLPVWAVVAVVAWLVRLPIPDHDAFTQLLLAAPAALLAGFLFIAVYPPASQTALKLLITLKGYFEKADNSRFPLSILALALKTKPGRWLVGRIEKAQVETQKQEAAMKGKFSIDEGK